MERDYFNDWYKKWFDRLREDPPGEVWGNISARLDVDEVWTKVDSRLTAIDRRKTIIRRAAYSLLVLLIGSAGTWLWLANKPNDTITAEHTARGNNAAGTGYSAADEKIIGGTNSLQPVSTVNTGGNLTSPPAPQGDTRTASPRPGNRKNTIHTSYTSVKESGSDVRGEKNPYVSSFEKSAGVAGILNTAEDVYFIPVPVRLVAAPRPDTARPLAVIDTDKMVNPIVNIDQGNALKGFYAGGVFMYKNSWLLNNTTLKGLTPQSTDQTNLHFGYAYGISAGYYLSPRLVSEFNVYLNSQQGQTYHTYSEGAYRAKEIRLDFMAFNFSLKRSYAGMYTFENLQIAHNLIAGINAGILKNGMDEMDTDGDGDNEYSNLDYGIRLGYEYDMLLYKRFLLAPAIIGDFGLKNIYKGSESCPGSFNRTYTSSIGLNIGIKYLLTHK